MISEYHKEFADRLDRVRNYLGMNISAFCRMLELNRGLYWRLRKGTAYGINIDSLYRLEKIEMVIAESFIKKD